MGTALEMLSFLLLQPPPADLTVKARFDTLQESAAKAYRDLCTSCRYDLLPHWRALVQLCNSPQVAQLAARQRMPVVDGTAAVVVLLEQDQEFMQALEQLCGALVTTLKGGLEGNPPTPPSILCDTLDCIQSIVRQVKAIEGSPREAAIGNFTAMVFPLLQQFLVRFSAESRLAEKCCRVLKHSMRCAPGPFKQLVPGVAETLVQAFRNCEHSSFLYSAEVLASEYGRQPDMQPILKQLYEQLSTIAVGLLQRKQSQLIDVVEVIEDYYGMSERYLRYCPTIVLESGNLTATLVALPLVLQIFQRDAQEAVVAFVTQFFTACTKGGVPCSPQVQQQALEVAPQVVTTLFRVLLAVPPGFVLDMVPQVLENVRECFPAQYPQWVGQSLAILPPQVLSESERPTYHGKFCEGGQSRGHHALSDLAYRAEQLALRSRNHKQ